MVYYAVILFLVHCFLVNVLCYLLKSKGLQCILILLVDCLLPMFCYCKVLDGYIAWAIVHRVCSSEIKVHYLDIIACLYCFPFRPSLTSARNQIQMAPALLNS